MHVKNKYLLMMYELLQANLQDQVSYILHKKNHILLLGIFLQQGQIYGVCVSFFIVVSREDSSIRPHIWYLLLGEECRKHALTTGRWVSDLLLNRIIKRSMLS